MPSPSVLYHYDGDGMWWAEVPAMPEYTAFGNSLDEVAALVLGGAHFFGFDVSDDALANAAHVRTTAGAGS